METTWASLTIPLIVGALILLIPGLIVAVALRQRGVEALGLAAPISVGIFGVSAIVASKAGIRFSLLVPLGFAVIVAAILYALCWFLERRGWLDAPASAHPVDSGQTADGGTSEKPLNRVIRGWFSREMLICYAGVLIGFVLLYWSIARAIGRPEYISQTYDANFHLNAIRYIADTGDASSLTIASMTSGGEPPAFYPAAWHGVATVIYQATGVSVPATANLVSVLVGAVIWPLSLMYLVRSTVRVSAPALLSVGIIAASYTAFPMLLINFGVLYPNSLGISALPVGLGLFAQLLRTVQVRRIETVPSLCAGFFVALGIALANPNVVMGMLAFALPIVLVRIVLQVRAVWRGELKPLIFAVQLVLLALFPVILNFLWGVVRPPKAAGGWEPATRDSTAIGEALFNGQIYNGLLWTVSVLALIGAYYLISRRSVGIWLVLSWVYAMYFYVASRWMTWDEGRDWVLGIWYHDPFRLAANVPALAAPVAVMGVHAAYLWLRAAVRLVGERITPVGERHAIISPLLAIVLLVPLGLNTQTDPNMQRYIEVTQQMYLPKDHALLISIDERDVINHLHEYVPAGDTVVVQPWTGGSLAYALTGYKVTATHPQYTATSNAQEIYQHLNEATPDSAVCSAIRSEKAYYYLDFKGTEINEHIRGDHRAQYPGLQDLKDKNVAEPVYSKGDATLYRITACN